VAAAPRKSLKSGKYLWEDHLSFCGRSFVFDVSGLTESAALIATEYFRGVTSKSLASSSSKDGFIHAGEVQAIALDLLPPPLPPGRQRHLYGEGPFARLQMPPLPDEPGLYLWVEDGDVVYIGQTRSTLKKRLGPAGYSTISNYNTFARQAGRRNGGQQTNCRINQLANASIVNGHSLAIWYRTLEAREARNEESSWMQRFGLPAWNRRNEGWLVSEANAS